MDTIKPIAVFDPTSSGTNVDEGTKVAIREIISSTFVNTGKYYKINGAEKITMANSL